MSPEEVGVCRLVRQSLCVRFRAMFQVGAKGETLFNRSGCDVPVDSLLQAVRFTRIHGNLCFASSPKPQVRLDRNFNLPDFEY